MCGRRLEGQLRAPFDSVERMHEGWKRWGMRMNMAFAPRSTALSPESCRLCALQKISESDQGGNRRSLIAHRIDPHGLNLADALETALAIEADRTRVDQGHVLVKVGVTALEHGHQSSTIRGRIAPLPLPRYGKAA